MKRGGKKPIATTTTQLSTSSSSATPRSSITIATSMEQQQPHNTSEFTKDSSCYFPGCRKDASCTCEICLDSINATLDRMPLTSQKKTSLSTSNNFNPLRPSPIPFGSPSSLVSTPKFGARRRFPGSTPSLSLCWKSTARARPKAAAAAVSEQDVGKRNRRRFGKLMLGFVILVLVLAMIELECPWVVSRALRPELPAEIVRDLGERVFELNGMNGKLRMLQSELELYVDARISNCNHNPRVWEVNQDGMLSSSRCVLYKSATEAVSVWGWPLQTAGVLVSKFSSRSLIVLSGRVTQWPEGNDGYVTVKARGSWVLDKYRASAVQLDGQTWVVEYSRRFLLEHEGLYSAAWKFLKYRLSRDFVRKISSRLGAVGETFRGYSAADGVNVHPTLKIKKK